MDRAGRLENKTEQLEKRLFLRQLITKALEIKRTEIIDGNEPNKFEPLPPELPITSSQESPQCMPQKLTFYDVVQLARQQALAKRTWKSSENLIDLSDTPQSVLEAESSVTVSSDLCLLDSSDLMVFQQIDFSLVPQNESETSKPSQTKDVTSTQSSGPEPEFSISQKYGMDLIKLDSLETSQAAQVDELRINESNEQSISTSSISIHHPESTLSRHEHSGEERSITLKSVGSTVSQADDFKTQEINSLLNPMPKSLADQSSSALINLGNDVSWTSTVSETTRPELSRSDGPNTQEIDLGFSSWTNVDQFSLSFDQLSIAPFDLENEVLKPSTSELINSEVSQANEQKAQEINDLVPSSKNLSRVSLSVLSPDLSLIDQDIDATQSSPTLKAVDSEFSQLDGPQKKEISDLLSPSTGLSQSSLSILPSDLSLIDRDVDAVKSSSKSKPVDSDYCQSTGLQTQEIGDISFPSTNFNEPSLPVHPSQSTYSGQESDINEVPAETSSISSAAPSIFSHSSTLSSATGSSLFKITEEEVQARNSSTNSPSLARKTASSLARSSIPETPFSADDADLRESSNLSFTPPSHADSASLFKLERSKSEDSVSLSSPQPVLSNIDKPDEQGFPWIVLAARDGNAEMVLKLLSNGANINALHSSTQRHALSEAAIQGHHKIVGLLIDEGSPLEHFDAEGYTALHHACQRGHLLVAKILITKKAPIDAQRPHGPTALHLAIESPSKQSVVMLLIQHKANINARDATFRTPLHISASQGNMAMCTYLLNEGATLDCREVQSKTPLQLACELGHYELVQMMLDRSNLNPTNMSFLAVFFTAVEYGHVQIAESFLSRGLKLQELKNDSYKPITLSAKCGSLDMIDLMINEQCDVNARNETGWNALHFSSYHGHYQVIERLIESGVSADVTTIRRETPLLFAARRNHFAVADRLLSCSKGSNLVNTEDYRSQQPVHHTARTGSVEIFSLLMSNGAKISGENSFGWQPLHVAVAYGHFALVQRLLQEGANIEEKLGSSSIKKDQTHKMVEEGYWAEARWPYPGSRPLHLACEYGHYNIASHLISQGAKMEATCNEGWQPLHHATYIGSPALVGMLLDSGAYPHATTNEGKKAYGLPFCTSGMSILEEDKERIRTMLKEAMDRTRKQKNFKVPMKRGATVEEKNKLVRAVTFSMSHVSKSQMEEAISTAATANASSPQSPIALNLPRPQIPHHSYTSPLPLSRSDSMPISQSLATPPLSSLQLETQSTMPPTASTTSLENTDMVASEVLTVNKTTDEALPLGNTDTSESPTTPDNEMQISAQRQLKFKRRTNLGLSKGIKPGIDMGKLGFSSISKQTFEISKQATDLGKTTLDFGKQTLRFGKQGIEMGKQELERGKHSFEMTKQGLELSGRQGFEKSMNTYKLAKQFAKKGKWKSGKIESGDGATKGKLLKDGASSRDGDNSIDETACDNNDNEAEIKVNTISNDDTNGHDENRNDDDDNEAISDDAGSEITMGGLDEDEDENIKRCD